MKKPNNPFTESELHEYSAALGEVDRAGDVALEMLSELENALEEFNPKECNCDGGYGDDGSEFRACYFHRIEEGFRRVIAKAKGGKK